MIIRALLPIALLLTAACCSGCPEQPEPPCTCRMIGFHACTITCVNVENEVTLEISLQSMRSATVPIRVVEIFDTHINFLPSRVFRGLSFPKLHIAGSSMVSLSDTDVAFVGLEDSLEILKVQECVLFGGWVWSQLKDLRALTELDTIKAGLLSIEGDVEAIAHLNITKLYFTQDSISYIHDRAFATFYNLVTLSLKRNSIRILNRTMFPDPALQLSQILLNYNELEFIPQDLFTNMPVLQFIGLAGNKLLTVDEAAFRPIWGHLKKFDLSENPLRCDCRLIWLLNVSFPLNTWAKCKEPQKLKGVSVKELTRNDLWC